MKPQKVAFALACLTVTLVGCGSPNSEDETNMDSKGGTAAGGSGGATSAGGTSSSGGTATTSGGSANGGSGGSAGTGTGGGGSPAGGSGGSAGAGPDPVIGDCEDLSEPGAWQLITPEGVKNTQAFALDPFNIGTIWLGASPRGNLGMGQGGIFKSTDCGATFTHVNEGTNGTEIDNASLWSLVLDHVTPGVIYAVGAYGPEGLWKSTNAGVDWTQLFPSGSEFEQHVPYNFVGSVTIDPLDPLHLAVGTHSDCTGEYAPTCAAETTDGGTTWSLFTTPFMAHWAEQTGPYIIDADTILYTLFDGMYVTTDHGTSWSDNITPQGVNGATGGEYTHRPIWQGLDGTYYLSSAGPGGLLKSSDGKAWSIVPGAPNGSYQLGFAVADGQIFMGDRNSGTYQVASESDLSTWTPLPNSPAPENEGAVFVEYDEAHQVLYSSNFEGGLWRMVME